MPQGSSPKSRLKTLGTIGEFGLIHNIHKRFGFVTRPVIHGIGDDAAVLRPQSGHDLLVTTDLLAEDIHFNLSCHSFKAIGYRAAIANLSDIAAMGGIPQALSIALAIPPKLSTQHLMEFYEGLMEPCREHGMTLIGGDTSGSPSKLFFSITVLGKIKQGCSLTRAGAKVSDDIYVTGTLGDSLAGLRLLQHRHKSRRSKRSNAYNRMEGIITGRHLRPQPRLEVGQWLVKRQIAHAAIDLSDGLSGDLGHLCDASQVGAELWAEQIPLSPEVRAFAHNCGEAALDLALRGGEDYELLFTAPGEHRRRIGELSRVLQIPITCIGKIRPKQHGMRLTLQDGSSRKILITSYHHFQTP